MNIWAGFLTLLYSTLVLPLLHYTLYTAHCTLHIEHYILYRLQIAQCTLDTAHCTLHNAQYARLTEDFRLHAVLHTTYYILHKMRNGAISDSKITLCKSGAFRGGFRGSGMQSGGPRLLHLSCPKVAKNTSIIGGSLKAVLKEEATLQLS